MNVARSHLCSLIDLHEYINLHDPSVWTPHELASSMRKVLLCDQETNTHLNSTIYLAGSSDSVPAYSSEYISSIKWITDGCKLTFAKPLTTV